MAKIRVCDVCLHDLNKITRTSNYLNVKGKKKLQFDLCATHMLMVRTRFPTLSVEYVQYMVKIAYNKEISEDAARALLQKKRKPRRNTR